MVGWMEDAAVYRATEVAHETPNSTNQIKRGSRSRQAHSSSERKC